MHAYFSLQGRTALVTGGTRGIGRMIAQGFLQAGARVFICARDAAACAEVAAELSVYGECIGLAADLSSEEGATALAEQLGAQVQQLDILVNNAGTTWGGPLESYPVKGWEKVMQLNVTSVFSCIQQLLPLLRKAGSAQSPARVINIGSVAGISSFGEQAYAYGPSKAALINFAEALALDLQPRGIGVRLINPGFVATPLTAQNDFSMPALQSAEEAAAAIIAGYRGRAFEIHFPKRFTCFMKLLALLPARFYFPLIRRMTGA